MNFTYEIIINHSRLDQLGPLCSISRSILQWSIAALPIQVTLFIVWSSGNKLSWYLIWEEQKKALSSLSQEHCGTVKLVSCQCFFRKYHTERQCDAMPASLYSECRSENTAHGKLSNSQTAKEVACSHWITQFKEFPSTNTLLNINALYF